MSSFIAKIHVFHEWNQFVYLKWLPIQVLRLGRIWSFLCKNDSRFTIVHLQSSLIRILKFGFCYISFKTHELQRCCSGFLNFPGPCHDYGRCYQIDRFHVLSFVFVAVRFSCGSYGFLLLLMCCIRFCNPDLFFFSIDLCRLNTGLLLFPLIWH